MTVAVAVGTAWLVVHYAESPHGRLERVLVPALGFLFVVCLVWFVFDPLITRAWRRAAGRPDPRPSVRRVEGGFRLGLHELRSITSVHCQVSRRNIVGHASRSTSGASEVMLNFPGDFDPQPAFERGRWHVLWLVLPMYQAQANVEAARDSFRWKAD